MQGLIVVAYKGIECKSALNRVGGRMPYQWDLNIYRGCVHCCAYCFALYSHQYLDANTGDFFNNIFVKTNIVDKLEEKLSSPRWNRAVVSIGGVTDSYQKA